MTDHGRSTFPDPAARLPGARPHDPDDPDGSRAAPAARPPAMNADELVAATGGTLLRRGSRAIRGAAVDSRLVEPGGLFIALAGERTDGHRFLADAAGAGAAGALVEHRPGTAAGEPALEALGDVTVVLVPDGLRALQATAAAWRARFDPLLVGVTGSIAKTSTKEAVAAVLAGRFATLRSEGNQNNEIGLPLTIMRLLPEHGAAVLEMGMYVGGEIRELAAIARPSIGVVTAVQPVHLSRIGSLDAIENAKAELVEALPPAADGGVAVLNADDARVRRMADRTAARVLTYGFADDAQVRAVEIESLGLDGMRFRLIAPGGERAAHTRGLGRMAVHNALAAAAVGVAAGMRLDEIVPGLAARAAAPHRAALIRAGGVVIVDDTYNASPGSMTAALDLLAGLPGRRVAILGQMLELGTSSLAGHRAVGATAAAVADLVIVVAGQPGGGASAIADGALEAGLPADRLVRAEDRDQAVVEAIGRVEPGDVVLVKASRGLGLEEAERSRLGVGLEVLIDALVASLDADGPR